MVDITRFSELDIYKIKDKYNNIVKSNMTHFNFNNFYSLLSLIGDDEFLVVDAYKTRHGYECKIHYKDVI